MKLETRQKISNALIGHKQSPETISKRIATIAPKNKGQKRTAAQRLRISEGTKRGMNNDEVRHKVREGPRSWLANVENRLLISKLTKAAMTKEVCEKIKTKRQQQIIPTKDTSIEVALQEVLEENNIKFITHADIFGQPDIFIEPNICIFADGDYWHNRPERIKRDICVNRELKSRNYKVLRFWEHEINENLESCFQRIKQTL